MALISLRSVAPARDVCSLVGAWRQPPQPITPPTPTYRGQALDPLYHFVQTYRTETPAIELQLRFVDDATVIVRSGLDGLILDKHGVAIKETSYYTDIFSQNIDCLDLEIEGPIGDLEDIFVSFDGAWGVYYHWLFFCLGSAGAAINFLPSSTSVAIPNWETCAPNRPSAISNSVFDEIKRVVDPSRLVTLSDGAYRARRAYFLYVEDGPPSDAILHSLYRDLFRSMRSEIDPSRQSRLFISRGGRGGVARVTESDEKLFDEVLIDYDVKKVCLENFSFQAQIDQFSNASLIISPHGSGLANLVFAPPNAKVLELQTEIDWPGALRPWFYLLAAVSGLHYAFLNREAGDFEAERLREGLKALGVSRPNLGRALRAWRTVQRRLDEVVLLLRKILLGRIRARLDRVFRAD